MKQIIFFFAILMATSSVVNAQIENIKLTNDSSIVIDKLYAGMLGTTMYRTDTGQVFDKNMNVRIGAMATWNATKYLSIRTFGIYEPGKTPFFVSSFWGRYKIGKFTTEAGVSGSLIAEQRPLPPTGNSHFETWTSAQLMGTLPTIKLHYTSGNTTIGAGVSVQNRLSETNKYVYQGSLDYKKFKLTGWSKQGKVGGALSYTSGPVYSLIVFKQNELLANATVIRVSEKKQIFFYSDQGYDFHSHIPRSEEGFFKNFSDDKKHIAGLVGAGYQSGTAENKGIKCYFFIFLK